MFFNPESIGLTLEEVHARLQNLPEPITGGMRERTVIHHQIHPQAVEDFIDTLRIMKEEKEKGGVKTVELKEDWEEEGKLRKGMALGY